MVSPYEIAIRLADKLCRLTPGDFPKKAVFVNSGAEAVENAVKIARYYTKRPAVVVFENAYHGRTLLTMTMTSKVKPYKFGFGPFAPEVYRMPFGDVVGPEKLKDFFVTHVNPEAVACVVAEPVQGEGGFITPPPGYFQELAKICRDNGILFVADEIQSGMGRTGKMFAIEHWRVEPDLVTVAKSLGAGMPIAAVVGRAEIMDSVHAGGLGGTYGANPVACAAALAVLEVFEEEDMLGKARALGKKLQGALRSMAQDSTRSSARSGAWAPCWGWSWSRASVASRPRTRPRSSPPSAWSAGLIILVCGTYSNVVRVLVPFVITDAELEKGLSILEQGLAEISNA